MAARPSDEPDTATHGRPEDVLYRQGPPAAAVIDGIRPNGASYRIEVPAIWNGRLVMYAHGYRGEGSELTVGNPSIRQWLLDNGYAWAASSYSTNFYDVRTGVEDTNELALAFTDITGLGSDRQQFGPGCQNREGRFVHLDIQLGPEDLVQAGLGTNLSTIFNQGSSPIGIDAVGLGPRPGIHDLVLHSGIDLVGVCSIKMDKTFGGRLESCGASQHKTPLESGGRHGHAPTTPQLAELIP